MAKISILRDQEKNMKATLWEMQEQMNTFQNNSRMLGKKMEDLHKELMTVRDERMKAERLKKVEKADKEEEK